jgi:hypothetical protein
VSLQPDQSPVEREKNDLPEPRKNTVTHSVRPEWAPFLWAPYRGMLMGCANSGRPSIRALRKTGATRGIGIERRHRILRGSGVMASLQGPLQAARSRTGKPLMAYRRRRRKKGKR